MALLLYLAGLIGAIGIGVGLPFGSRRGDAVTYEMTLLGQDTVINAKGGNTRKIRRMTMWAGKLFLGYGDNDETGRPLPTRYYDFSDSTFKSLGASVDTDTYYSHWSHNDRLYLLVVDPAGTAADQDYVTVTAGLSSSIHDADPPYAEHVYHAATHSDGNLYLCGERRDGTALATVWRTTDDGTTWDVAYESPTAAYYWYPVMFHLNGELWVQAYDPIAPALRGNAFKSSDGTTWTDAGFRFTGYMSSQGRAVVFNGYAFIAIAGTFHRFDGLGAGTNLQPTLWFGYPCTDVCIDNGFIYTICSGTFGHKVNRSSDGVNWTTIYEPANPLGTYYESIEVFNGTIYLGTSQAYVYKIEPSSYTIPADFVTDAGGRQVVTLDGEFVTNG